MKNESIGKRGMDINYKASQGQTERAVVLQEEEEERKQRYRCDTENNIRMNFGRGGLIHRQTEDIVPCKLN